MKVLITSGGCKVPIDDVRHIGNFSSGRYGAELAKEIFNDAIYNKRKTEIIFFMEKGSVKPFDWRDDWMGSPTVTMSFREYKDYDQYLTVKDIIKEQQPNLIISAAAISDYIVDKIEGKISSNNDELVIKLRKGEKVIQSFRELAPLATIVGFKLLVSPSDEEKFEAISKQLQYVDHVIYNDLTELRNGNDKRELVIWAENGIVRSRPLSNDHIIKHLIEEAQVNSVLKKVFK